MDKITAWINSYAKSKSDKISPDNWTIESWLGYHFSQPTNLYITEKENIWALAYKRDYYIKLNAALRRQDETALGQFGEMVKNLDNLIEKFKPTPEAIHVFRIQNDKFHSGPFQIGEFCLLRAYTSTSLRESFPVKTILRNGDLTKVEDRDDLWVLEVPAGTRALFMNIIAHYDWHLWHDYFSKTLKSGHVPDLVPYKPIYYYDGKDEEKEFLLPRNTWIKITALRINKNQQYTRIGAEVVHQPKECNLDLQTSCCVP